MYAISDDQITEIWAAYKAEPNEKLRNSILEHYLPLVEKSARRLRGRMPGCVEVHDLIGYAGETRTSLPADERAADPARESQRSLLKEMITKGLSQSERLVIILDYYEALTMKGIGQTLDLSESRVSQMHSSVIHRLKAQMRAAGSSRASQAECFAP